MVTARLPRSTRGIGGGRSRCVLSLLLLTALLAAACGGGGSPSPATKAAATEGPAGNAFPVTIQHRYGSTVVPKAPERVITLGLSDQDPVLALGVRPIALTDWYGDYPSSTWPWAQDKLGDAKPTILEQGEFDGVQQFNYEQIAGLRPDLILSMYSGTTKQEYETLSKIAPTVLPTSDFVDYGISWQAATRLAGKALGRSEQAEKLVSDVEGKFAQAREQHPEFKGLQAIVAERDAGTGASFARAPQDPRTRFMTSLGFVLPDEIAKLSGDQDGAEVSDERMDLMDRDLLVWNIGYGPEVRPEIEANKIYQQLGVTKAGRVVWVDDPVEAGALTWSTVLSVPYAIDKLVPKIAEAVAKPKPKP